MAPSINCEFNQYYIPSSASCVACTGCAQTWPWCAISGCTSCYSTLCTACTGFGYSYCTACSNSNTAPDCVTGLHCTTGSGLFTCTTCNSGYTLIDGLCLIPPYGYNSGALLTPVIAINFNTFEQYYGGIFQSGSSATTWGPFNSPSTDDPIPVAGRGMYFDGVSRYMASTSNVVMNYQSSVAAWVYSLSSGTPIMSTSLFLYSSNSNAKLTLNSPSGVWPLSTYNAQASNNQWSSAPTQSALPQALQQSRTPHTQQAQQLQPPLMCSQLTAMPFMILEA